MNTDGNSDALNRRLDEDEARDRWEELLAAEERVPELENGRDEALNQLDSARHSVSVLERRVAEAERRGMERAAVIAKNAQLKRVEGTVGGVIEQVRHNICATIRAEMGDDT